MRGVGASSKIEKKIQKNLQKSDLDSWTYLDAIWTIWTWKYPKSGKYTYSALRTRICCPDNFIHCPCELKQGRPAEHQRACYVSVNSRCEVDAKSDFIVYVVTSE